MNWFSKAAKDPVAQRYLDAHREKRPGRRDPFDADAVVIDAETTGFQAGVDRILSVAAIAVRGEEALVSTAAGWLVRQDSALVNAATQVHGILPSESAEGVSERAVMEQLLELMRARLIVGHHIGFDLSMLNEAMRRHFGIVLKNPYLDTSILAMQEIAAFHKTGYANQRPPGLEEVCLQLGLPMMDRHTAAGDAFTTATVYLSLIGRLRARLGREPRWGDLPIGRA